MIKSDLIEPYPPLHQQQAEKLALNDVGGTAGTPIHNTVIAACRAVRLPQLEIGRNRVKFRGLTRQEELT